MPVPKTLKLPDDIDGELTNLAAEQRYPKGTLAMILLSYGFTRVHEAVAEWTAAGQRRTDRRRKVTPLRTEPPVEGAGGNGTVVS